MTTRVSILDYGMGNLFSVSRAVEACGADPVLVDTPEGAFDADILILPGVGAFADGMAGLRERGLVEAIQAYAQSGRPLMGICLGMQMLLDGSDEFSGDNARRHEGLGLIPGHVAAIPAVGTDGRPHKIPHIGWNSLQVPPARQNWQSTLLADIPPETRMYFVHSFTPQPAQEAHRLADCDYNGQRIAAIIQADHVYGCQFHPEKSGPLGLQILRNFIALKQPAKRSA